MTVTPLAPPKPVFEFDKDQSKFLDDGLGWLADPDQRFGTLQGVGGSGKTTLICFLIHEAYKRRLLAGRVAGMGVTHTAKKQLKASAGRFRKYAPEYPEWLDEKMWYSTFHSALRLFPKEEKWDKGDQEDLEELLRIKLEDRSRDVERMICQLQFRKEAAGKEDLVFRQNPEGCDLGDTQLIIADECSMVPQDIFYHLCNLWEKNQIRPDAKILFMGDDFQLPPIGEAISKTFEFPYLGNFTEVHRNAGALQHYALSIRKCTRPVDLASLHFPYLGVKGPEGWSPVKELSYRDAIWGTVDQIKKGEQVVWIAARNDKVEQINDWVRRKLYGGVLDYREGDEILTRRPVRRGGLQRSGPFANAKKGKPLVDTSSVVTLTQELGVGDWAATNLKGVKYSDLDVRLQENHFEMTAATGTVYRRSFWRYEFDDPEDNPQSEQCLILLDPNQRKDYLADLEHLKDMRDSFYSRGSKVNTARGQNGASAKCVWEIYGLKSWYKFKDGTPVSAEDYNQIKREVQRNYFELLNFVDATRYAYARTIHNMQGDQARVIVVDAATVFPRKGGGGGYRDPSWDPIRNTYTTVSRAQLQVIIAT